MGDREFEEYAYYLLKAEDWRASTAKSTSSAYMSLFAMIFSKHLIAGYHGLGGLVKPEIPLCSLTLTPSA